MTTFCIFDVAIGDSVEIVASDTVTPRVQQMLQIHGKCYIFDGLDADQDLIFTTSPYGRLVYFPRSQVFITMKKS